MDLSFLCKLLNSFWGKINTWKKSNDKSYIMIWLAFSLQVGVECSENVAFSSPLLSRRSSRCFWLDSVLHTNTWWHTPEHKIHMSVFSSMSSGGLKLFSAWKAAHAPTTTCGLQAFQTVLAFYWHLFTFARLVREQSDGVYIFSSTAAFAALLAEYLITSLGRRRAN